MLDDKVRWVLRNARQHAAEPELRTAAGFAAGAGRVPAVHRAQVGRWEGGGVEVTHELVRRYEVVLELPEGQLLRAIDYFSREELPLRTTPTLVPRRPPDFDETLALLERALGTERMSGLDWERLSSNVSRMPHALVRGTDWEQLIERCILEMTVAVGLEFAHRDEAVARLAGHPRSGAIVVSMARRMLADSSTAVYSAVATLLVYASDPSVVPVLLEHAAAPANADSLRAVLFVLTMLVPSGRIDPAAAATAARLALAVARDGTMPFHVHRAAANLLRSLDLPHRNRLASVLTADDHRHVARILMEGRALGLDAVAALNRRLLAALFRSLGPVDTRDAVLRDLLDTVLTTTEELARSTALGVLMLSPQGRPVGIAYAAELGRALRRGDDVVAVECLSILTWLVQPEGLDELTSTMLDPSTRPEQAMLCGIAVGNCAEPSSPVRAEREAAIARRARALVADPGIAGNADGPVGVGGSEAVRQRLRGLAYALAMRGRFDLLAQLEADVHRDHPHAPTCHGVLGWWLALPEHARPRA